MDYENFIREQDLVENPAPRVPICLCLDTSGSMGRVVEGGIRTGETFFEDGEKWYDVQGGITVIDKLREGVKLFYDAIREDEIAALSAEICIVTFDDEARCIVDFANIERQGDVPELIDKGNTAMGEGVNLALDLLDRRKQEYKDKGVDYFQPWLVLMTDGEPNGDPRVLQNSIERTCRLVNSKKLTVFPIGIGIDVDMDTLGKFSPNRTPLKLQGLKFKEFFEWLSKSVSKTSQSMPGEKIDLDLDGIKGWSEL